MPSAPAARPRPCCARGRAATRSGSRTSRWTAARPSAGPSSSRSWPATRAARRRIRARPATAPTAWRRSSASPSGSGRVTWRPGTTRGSSSATGGRSSARGADAAKDQSYMLARVPPEVLERLRLPLGDATKAAVRAEAAAAGLAAATARESQDVCFLGGGALDDFLAREGVQLDAGSIRDEAGHELGRHAGRGRLHARPAPRASASRRRRSSTCCAPTLRATSSSWARGAGSPAARCCCARRACEEGATRVHAKLRGRSPTVAASVEQVPGRPAPAARGAGLRGRRGPDGGALRRRTDALSDRA